MGAGSSSDVPKDSIGDVSSTMFAATANKDGTATDETKKLVTVAKRARWFIPLLVIVAVLVLVVVLMVIQMRRKAAMPAAK